MNSTWQDAFAPWILERGATYHQLGRVIVTRYDGRVLRADVRGSEMYHVTILLSGGLPAESSCTCPHAQKGWLCKHMAAALMEAERLDGAFPSPEPDGGVSAWEQALESLPPELLRIALRYLAEGDPAVQEMLLTLARGVCAVNPDDE